MPIVAGKVIGRRKPLFADWSIPVPPEAVGGRPFTLRDLIEHVVRAEVAAFRTRQQERQFLRALTAREIDQQLLGGKVQMGNSPEVELQEINDDSAVAVALQAFEDGIYLVAIDDENQRELDREIHLQPDSRVTFVRLTMLAGG